MPCDGCQFGTGENMSRIALLLLASTLASAQQPTAVLILQSDPTFRALAEKTFLQYENSLSTHCPKIAPDWSRAHQTLYVAPVVDAKNRLTSGAWSEMVPGTACGQPRNFRALAIIRDGRMNLSRQLPGASNTTAVLERDVRRTIISSIREHYAPDDLQPSFDVFDTVLLGPDPPPVHQSWKEIWLIRINGHSLRVSIVFFPDQPDGSTNFHIAGTEVADTLPTNR